MMQPDINDPRFLSFLTEAVATFQAANTTDATYFVDYIVYNPQEPPGSGKWEVSPIERPTPRGTYSYRFPWLFGDAWLRFQQLVPAFATPQAKVKFLRLWQALEK